MKIIWSPRSRDDLDSIYEYIAHDSKQYAKSFVERLINQVGKIADHPNSGRTVPEVKNNYIREKIFLDYRIIYFIDSDSISIITIHHGSRKFRI